MKHQRCHRRPLYFARHQGLALVAVLWIVAALGIAATGMLRAVKSEIRVVSQQRQVLAASALADAAIRLVLQSLVFKPGSQNTAGTSTVSFGGQRIVVEWAPLNGLIDINSAPEPLLAAMFQHMGELPAAAAESLAKQAVEARSRKDPQGQKEGFDAPEDLLRVPGIDYPLYARIAPFVTSSLSGSGLVNPQAAPVSVLTVLAQGNATLAQQFASARGSTPQAMDTTRLTSAFLDPNSSSSLRIMANVQGGTVQKTWWVSLTPSDRSGLPWQFMGQRVTTDTP